MGLNRDKSEFHKNMSCFFNCLRNSLFYFLGIKKTISLANLSIYSCLTLAHMCNPPRILATLKIFYYFGWRKGLSVYSTAKGRVRFQEHVCLFWTSLTAEQFGRFRSSEVRSKRVNHQLTGDRHSWKIQLMAGKARPTHIKQGQARLVPDLL